MCNIPRASKGVTLELSEHIVGDVELNQKKQCSPQVVILAGNVEENS